MGCCFSCKRRPPTASTVIKVVHLDGYIEQLEAPVTVCEVIGKPPKHALFTHAQLLSNASTPLKLDAPLEGGRVYFLLPLTLFKTNVSPTELAPLVRKLVARAQSKREMKNMTSGSNSNSNGSPATSPNRLGVDAEHAPAKCRPWKPILSTIREISFNRRTESDVREEYAS